MPTPTKVIHPLLTNIVTFLYLKKVTQEAAIYKINIKDFSNKKPGVELEKNKCIKFLSELLKKMLIRDCEFLFSP